MQRPVCSDLHVWDALEVDMTAASSGDDEVICGLTEGAAGAVVVTMLPLPAADPLMVAGCCCKHSESEIHSGSLHHHFGALNSWQQVRTERRHYDGCHH
jgi:hypothetical protein